MVGIRTVKVWLRLSDRLCVEHTLLTVSEKDKRNVISLNELRRYIIPMSEKSGQINKSIEAVKHLACV